MMFILLSEPEFTYSADDEQKKCKTALCECDSQAAKCFSEAYFNKSYAVYDTSKCWRYNNTLSVQNKRINFLSWPLEILFLPFS